MGKRNLFRNKQTKPDNKMLVRPPSNQSLFRKIFLQTGDSKQVHRQGVGKYIPKAVAAGVKRSSGLTESDKTPTLAKKTKLASQHKQEYGDFSRW